jgi:hypothetical protein
LPMVRNRFQRLPVSAICFGISFGVNFGIHMDAFQKFMASKGQPFLAFNS